MATINRLITTICSDNLQQSVFFYTSLFDFDIRFDSDWFVQLVSKDNNLELGIIDRSNALVPVNYQKKPTGFYITFVVDNVDELVDLAKKNGFEIVEEPKDTFYGQRRLLLKDPSGSLIDVSSPIPVF